ncbi:MAG: ABC transporter ATP-binding protein [Ferruginibacter sp.]|nr:ABC transporter ATP-binding protein [Ferruginibacter sp.]
MKTLKNLFKKYFQYFHYFYTHLGYRIFFSLFLNILVGLMDGLGLAMFIPLLQMVDGKNTKADNGNMGNLSFLADIFNYFGITLTMGVVLCVIFFFFTLKGILKFAEGYARVMYEQRFINTIRTRNIKGLANFSYNIFVNADTGRIQNTFSGEVERVNQAYRFYFVSIQYGIFVLVYISMALVANPKFALLVVVGGGLTNLIFRKMQKTTKALSKKLTTDNHFFQGILIQKVTFFKYLKSTGLIHRYADKLIQQSNKIQHTQRKTGLIAAGLGSMREPLIVMVVMLVILVQVNVFHQSIGIIILSLLLFYRALVSLMGMQNFWNQFLNFSGSLQNMTAFNAELKAGREKVGLKSFTGFKNKLELRDVSFSYENSQILSNIDASLKKNETIAIVGESGSGKTTLINIVTGLLSPTLGKVLIDGAELEESNRETFQRKLGYITQEPVIFSDTIFNNVTFWDEPTEENKARFIEALKQASIYNLVMSQPLKGDAPLGSNGINISGGQKQRLSIARELYKEVDFLFMDEATSALDSETERDIQENIEKLKGRYTIVIIAHRLSTIKNADRIILLNKGRIEQVGTFDELLSTSAPFKKMVQLQGFTDKLAGREG